MGKKFYITTTLPYVNADPHMGHALEFVQTDIIARYKMARGFDTFMNTGTDEHGVKIFNKAEEVGIEPMKYTNKYAKRFQELLHILNVSDHNFIRTTDPGHKEAAQEFWRTCDKNGDIYKKMYKIRYCVGCELEKTDSDLMDGKCPEHPSLLVEDREEENYFFRFSKYQKPLLDLYKDNPDFVTPEARLNEVRAFVERGLQDFSVSRLKEKMSWGIPVPDDSEHVMYVWFDALVNYISAIGWPTDKKKFEKWWPVVQIAGKDNVRQQAAMWQAMLMSAGISPSRQIVIHGFITSEGQKMSKTLGNVINPLDIIHKYGVDAIRYYFAREVNTFEDSDITEEKFKEAYNANLANGLGNVVSRIMKMSETHLEKIDIENIKIPQEFNEFMEVFEIQKAVDCIWQRIGELDAFIQKKEPFKKIKTDKQAAKKDIVHLVENLKIISTMLMSFMPKTAESISRLIDENKMPKTPLFARVD